MDDDTLRRIEAKLDKLLSIWERFEPLVKRFEQASKGSIISKSKLLKGM